MSLLKTFERTPSVYRGQSGKRASNRRSRENERPSREEPLVFAQNALNRQLWRLPHNPSIKFTVLGILNWSQYRVELNDISIVLHGNRLSFVLLVSFVSYFTVFPLQKMAHSQSSSNRAEDQWSFATRKGLKMQAVKSKMRFYLLSIPGDCTHIKLTRTQITKLYSNVMSLEPHWLNFQLIVAFLLY